MANQSLIQRVFIEISGKCNAACSYCIQNRLRKKGHYGDFMSANTFEKVIDHLLKIGIIDQHSDKIICPFNWGEPFLNPEFNEILAILHQRGLKASISSNFITLPKLDEKLFSNIEQLTLSLSGFSQNSYQKIHGANLAQTLDNFKDFSSNLLKHSPNAELMVSWHRYKFNEKEFWQAHEYFHHLNIPVYPVRAFLNDGVELLNYLEGKGISQDRLNQIEKEVFTQHLKQQIAQSKIQSDNNYQCPQFTKLVISERAELMRCCAFSRYDEECLFGNILEMTKDEIMKAKIPDKFCYHCISEGVAKYMHNLDSSWPKEQGRYAKKILLSNKFNSLKRRVAGRVRRIPGMKKTHRNL